MVHPFKASLQSWGTPSCDCWDTHKWDWHVAGTRVQYWSVSEYSSHHHTRVGGLVDAASLVPAKLRVLRTPDPSDIYMTERLDLPLGPNWRYSEKLGKFT